jgi:Ca2+-binding EF-hand superfamily protein
VEEIMRRFKRAMFSKSISKLQTLAQVFRRIDEDESGKLSFSEFKAVSDT